MTSIISNITRVLVTVIAVAALAFMSVPQLAFGLDTAKTTAKPNGDIGSDVMGATETRITWEGQAGPDEVVDGFTLIFPEGTAFTTDNARITMLTGDDLMTRTVMDADVTSDGQRFFAMFPGQAEPGGYFRIEVYGVFFPASGGEMQIEGTYLLSDGSEYSLKDIPAITVQSVSQVDQFTTWLDEQEWVKAWNSNKFLRLFFNPTLIVTSLPIVFKGFLMALGIVLCAFPLAIPIGFVLSLMRMAKLRILRAIASLYVNVVRGTPLFLQIYIAFFGLPLAGVQIPSFPLGVIVLSMNSAAYLCEIFRAGIQSIPKGQTEAARSLGMSGAQTMIFVIIPQTVLRVIPTMTSEFILLYKDTSMLAAVGVMEVVMYAKTIVASTGSITPYIVAAIFYLIITLPLAKVIGKLEARLAGGTTKRTRKAKGTDAAGVTGFATDALAPQPLLKNDSDDALAEG